MTRAFLATLLFACTKTPVVAVVEQPAARVEIGSPDDEKCRDDDETRRSVVVARFAMQTHEVTQADFEKRMGYSPAHHDGCPRCPVERITAYEAEAYCNALSRDERRRPCYACRGARAETRCEPVAGCDGFRLPTEVEWELAARANDIVVTSCMGTDPEVGRVGWYKANSGGSSHPVGSKAPARGLYDLAGNVYEWTADTNEDGERRMKGGSWYHNAEHARPANREAFRADKRLTYVGFRCVRDLRP
jgi:formylglycine-generating enzyme required for sulfatase activity